MTMRERVANAVHAELEKRGIILVGEDWIPAIGGAAIEAMREPTEAMVVAGMDYDERELELKFGRPPTVEECQIGEWQAQIDEALK